MIIVNDTFTDTAGTNLSAHTGEVGASWTYFVNESNIVITTDNHARDSHSGTPDVGETAMAKASAIPATPDYDIRATYHCMTMLPKQFVGILGRYNDVALGSGADLYRVLYQVELTKFYIEKKVNDVNTELGSYTVSLSPATAYDARLRLRGSALTFFLDGVQRIAATDASITAAGRVGVQFYAETTEGNPVPTDSTAIHFDDFDVDQVKKLVLT